MRVVHVDTSTEWRGGQTQLLYLLQRRRSDWAVVHPQSPLREALAEQGLQHRTVAFSGSFFGSRALGKALRLLKPDLVAAHTSHAHSQCILARPEVPLIVHRRLDFRHPPSRARRWKYAKAQGYVAVSEAVAAVLRGLGVAAETIRVVHDGVDVTAVSEANAARDGLCTELGWSPDVPVILAAGALVPHKGHRFLVRAIEHVPNVNLVIAGHGACHDSLQTDIIARGLADRVVLLGHRPDLYSLMKSADVFCHPSTEEGMGQVVAEALIAGFRSSLRVRGVCRRWLERMAGLYHLGIVRAWLGELPMR